MKKQDQKITLLNPDDFTNKDQIDNYKTTNVNILLNRVRLDKKRTLKKRIIITLCLVASITSVVVYFII